MSFDFEAHRRQAVDEYSRVRGLYADFATTLEKILRDSLREASIKVQSVESRAKSVGSFAVKAVTPSEADPNRPKYDRPLEQITDLAGVRVITFFPLTVAQVCGLIEREFVVRERIDKGEELFQQERFGYQSVHYLVQLSDTRLSLSEYQRFRGLIAEIQVRTVLQHAWAEIEHDIEYKSTAVIPRVIRRRFADLAGLLEIADREFQSIQNQDAILREEAVRDVERGSLQEVEVTPFSLKAYLDKKLGSDARVSDFSYQWTAKWLRALGFAKLSQVDDCISSYNDDSVSRAATGTRQGQISRFELMLLAGMGEAYIERHPLARSDANEGYKTWLARSLDKLRQAGIPIGSYVPEEDASAEQDGR